MPMAMKDHTLPSSMAGCRCPESSLVAGWSNVEGGQTSKERGAGHDSQVTREASRRGSRWGASEGGSVAHGGVVERLRHNPPLQPTPLTRRG